MSYKDVIAGNEIYAPARWWPHYAYHCTDVRNAVSILESRMLYSRTQAEKLDVMMNDNASRQVINMTSPETASFVRFYFRPLTPAQYHNEGYKHRAFRYDGDPNANVPVPVFLFFHLDKLLEDPSAFFSEGSEAGAGSPKLQGEEAFAGLDFKGIYGNGPYISKDAEGKKREGSLRQSEILFPDRYPIDRSLAGIVCRNAAERTTLLNLLKDKSYRLFNWWQPRIRVINQYLYYNNGLFITECSLHDEDFSVTFSDAYPRKRYAKAYEGIYPVKAAAQFEWLHREEVLDRRYFDLSLDYFNTKPISFHGIPEVKKAQELSVKIFLDSRLMCYQKYSLLRGEY